GGLVLFDLLFEVVEFTVGQGLEVVELLFVPPLLRLLRRVGERVNGVADAAEQNECDDSDDCPLHACLLPSRGCGSLSSLVSVCLTGISSRDKPTPCSTGAAILKTPLFLNR